MSLVEPLSNSWSSQYTPNWDQNYQISATRPVFVVCTAKITVQAGNVSPAINWQVRVGSDPVNGVYAYIAEEMLELATFGVALDTHIYSRDSISFWIPGGDSFLIHKTVISGQADVVDPIYTYQIF